MSCDIYRNHVTPHRVARINILSGALLKACSYVGGRAVLPKIKLEYMILLFAFHEAVGGHTVSTRFFTHSSQIDIYWATHTMNRGVLTSGPTRNAR